MEDDVEDALRGLAGPLRIFAAVAEHGHVTRAAQQLGLGQPTVSRALTRVAEAVGVPLVVPAGRGVRLTAAGEVLAATAVRALAELERGVRRVREDDDPRTGRVALGFLHTLGASAVPALVRAFREENPRARFSLRQGAAGALLAELDAGAVDLVLTSPLPQRPGLVAHALREQPLVLALPSGHRLAARARLRLADVAEEEFVVFEPGYGLRSTVDGMFAEAGIVPRIAFEGQDADTVRGLVAAGLGLAVLPAAAGARGVVDRPIDGPTTSRTLGLVWRDGDLPRAAAAFRDTVLRHPDPLGGDPPAPA